MTAPIRGTGDAEGLLALTKEPPFPGFVAMCRRFGVRVIKQKAAYGGPRSRVFVEDYAWVLVEYVHPALSSPLMETALARLAAEVALRPVVYSTLLLLGRADLVVLTELGLIDRREGC